RKTLSVYWPRQEPVNPRNPMPKPRKQEFHTPMKTGRQPNQILKIKMQKAFCILQFAFWSANAIAFGADIQLSASLDRQRVAMNEQAVLSVVISGNVSNLPSPQMPGLPTFQISDAGTSQSYTWVNGQASASVTHTYVLTPTQVGQFTIPPVRLTVEGKTLESSP